MTSSGVATLGQLYGAGRQIFIFANEHIDSLKHADNALANRCGEVLHQVIEGFGIGESAGLTLIGLGQALLGNPLTGAAAVATAAVNPVVLTCASIGAVHYGWAALSEKERNAILQTVSTAFDVGTELVRSIARFALDIIKTRMTRENLADLRRFVAENAAFFGKKLSEITGALSDRARELAAGTTDLARSGAKAVRARIPHRNGSAK